MEWLVCKACGANAILPMDVSVDGEDVASGQFEIIEPDEDLAEEDYAEATDEQSEHESRFFSCHVCGDNWLAVKEQAEEGDCHVTFIHQMGMAPVLKRIARMQTHVVVNDNTVESWEYFLDDERVDEEVWLEKLNGRRRVLKSVCSN